jgi:hypothetical protein
MPFVFSRTEYCNMHFLYAFCDGKSLAAVEEYWKLFPDRSIPCKGVHQVMSETGCFPSVCVQFGR